MMIRAFLNPIAGKSNPLPEAGERFAEIDEFHGFSGGRESEVGGAEMPVIVLTRLRGQPEQQAVAQGRNASSMMVLMVRAQRPHSALQPRQS